MTSSSRFPTFPTFLAILLFLVSAVSAEDWPGWRGPRGDGSSRDNPPLSWDGTTGKNIRWRVPIPGEGHASPIVSGDRVYVVTCLPETLDRVLICLDRNDGSTIWSKAVIKAPLESKHRLNSHASSTPATDGEHIFVTFLHPEDRLIEAPNVGNKRKITPGTMVTACYDRDGREVWKVTPGDFVSAHGFCSCPVLFEDLVILNGDHDGDSYVLALDKKTGKTVWTTPRKHKTRSYVTPLIREIDGKPQMVFSGSKRIVSLDPRTGKTNWLIEGPTEQFVASMVYDGKKFYMAAGFPTYHVMGIDPTGRGDVTKSHVAWHSTKATCYVPSPVVVDRFLYVADDRGTANCFDTETGERIWKERLGKHYSSSLLSTNKHVFFVADEGVTTIIEAGEQFKVVAKNPLGEYTFASPALSDGQLFIRGEKHLFCIEEK